MPSIRSLIDTFGHPPDEIILDWVWQLKSSPGSCWQNGLTHLNNTAQPVLDIRALDDQRWSDCAVGEGLACDWQTLEVAIDGTLTLQDHDGVRAQAALRTLQGWLNKTSSPAGHGLRDHQTSDLQLSSSVIDRSIQDESDIDESNPDKSNGLQPSDRLRCGGTRRSLRAKHRQRVITSALVATACLTLAAGVWIANTPTSSSARPQGVGSKPHTAADGSRSNVLNHNPLLHELPPAEAVKRETSAQHELSADLSTQPLTTLSTDSLWSGSPLIDASSTQTPSLNDVPRSPASLIDLKIASSLTANVRPNASDATASSAAESVSTPTGAPTGPGAGNALDEPSISRPVGAMSETDSKALNVDLLSTVNEAMQMADSETVATASTSPASTATLATSSLDQNNTPPQEPLPDEGDNDHVATPSIFFARDLLKQKLNLPKRASPRPRESTWSVELTVPELFTLEPEPVQGVTIKSVATWRLYDNAASSPRTCLVVQVAQRSQRDAWLNTLTYAAAEDLPQLTLPLNRQFLDPLRVRLQTATLNMRSLSDAATIAASSGGSLLSKEQRQTLKQQLKLAERLCEIIADADRLASLLDGEVEMKLVR